MTLHEEIELLQSTREQIKQAIITKGQSITDEEQMKDWIDKIGNIPSVKQDIRTDTQYLLKEILEGTVEYIDDNNLTMLRSNCLQRCNNLKQARFSKLLKIAPMAFNSCSKLYTLILNTDKMVKLDSVNAFQFTPIGMGTGKIYVNDDLIEQYKTDKRWKKFTNQFIPIGQLK